MTATDAAPTPNTADPAHLAELVAARPHPVLVGLDVDGVLAPIVAHADDAALLPGVLDAVTALAARTPVAVVSGRRLDDLLGFGFTTPVEVVGTHGLERLGAGPLALTADEQGRYDELHRIAADAAEQAGDGAWVEIKRASVVLHVREADPVSAAAATDVARRRAEAVLDAQIKAGKSVLELLVRATSKATAMRTLRQEVAAASVVFVGDDHTDEEVFADLRDRPADVSIRVGPGDTAARHRLADPAAVNAFLDALVARLPAR